MKKLMMVFGMMFTSSSSFAAGAITLQNKTDFPAQFVVKKGGQVLARIPGISPGETVRIPTCDSDDRDCKQDPGNFNVYAVVNGVTSNVTLFSNDSAVVTAIESYYYGMDYGYLELVVE